VKKNTATGYTALTLTANYFSLEASRGQLGNHHHHRREENVQIKESRQSNVEEYNSEDV
jgi:hypothetical protein